MHYYTSFEEQDKIEHFRCCLRLRKKFSRIYFAVIWFILFLVAIAFFLLSPTTKWLSKESAILDDIITLIIVCFWTYRFMVPSFVKSKRRNWYKKILPEQSASLYVQISASHLEFCSATGKSVIFSYKPQTKKGERNLPKKDQTIGEIIEAKNGIYFVGSDIELVDVGPVLFVDKNDVPAEDYSKLREMLKGVFLEKYYDYSAE